jgi:large subunit ribosomal protein L15
MLKLNKLVPAGKKGKRVGRGGARGGPSGRGFGGQNARSGGGVSATFEGGQMPLIRRLPKRGFSNVVFAKDYEIVRLQQLNDAFENGATVTYDMLRDQGFIKGKKGKLVKILANGALKKKLTVHAHACSAAAHEAIKKQGGEVQLIGE